MKVTKQDPETLLHHEVGNLDNDTKLLTIETKYGNLWIRADGDDVRIYANSDLTVCPNGRNSITVSATREL